MYTLLTRPRSHRLPHRRYCEQICTPRCTLQRLRTPEFLLSKEAITGLIGRQRGCATPIYPFQQGSGASDKRLLRAAEWKPAHAAHPGTAGAYVSSSRALAAPDLSGAPRRRPSIRKACKPGHRSSPTWSLVGAEFSAHQFGWEESSGDPVPGEELTRLPRGSPA